MNRLALKSAAALAAAVLGVTTPAAAAIVDVDVTFAASDFYAVRGVGAPPVDPVSGRVQLSFDDAADIAPTSNGLVATGLDFAGGPLLYAYDKANDALRFATSTDVFDNLLDGDFLSFFIFAPSTQPAPSNVAYSLGGYSIFVARQVTVTDPGAVPEPGAWALMILGFGALGAQLRRRRRNLAAA
ncbi:MAG: PEP-CTERM sorting domain-containing protein [Phenylobacterium sp.]|uniref:PEPxxWA-CTERM sorting domain-containing protein n=1 Tax=Phenylobacterium sp. TaxID=1871053 RepID=UPI0011FDF2D3|nr:PEPxxWA-CTERM sorting domain-containing protein [Phenylobacterium sp.]TAL32312.1 MAG: PEP-CTERM sorting domain-containing protein [Phenylobacterium sp.]